MIQVVVQAVGLPSCVMLIDAYVMRKERLVNQLISFCTILGKVIILMLPISDTHKKQNSQVVFSRDFIFLI